MSWHLAIFDRNSRTSSRYRVYDTDPRYVSVPTEWFGSRSSGHSSRQLTRTSTSTSRSTSTYPSYDARSYRSLTSSALRSHDAREAEKRRARREKERQALIAIEIRDAERVRWEHQKTVEKELRRQERERQERKQRERRERERKEAERNKRERRVSEQYGGYRIYGGGRPAIVDGRRVLVTGESWSPHIDEVNYEF